MSSAKYNEKKIATHDAKMDEPRNSRLRNPLNVVLQKISSTRATVHGDLSKEGLKELLMSSLSLLPKVQDSKNTGFGESDLDREVLDSEGRLQGSPDGKNGDGDEGGVGKKSRSSKDEGRGSSVALKKIHGTQSDILHKMSKSGLQGNRGRKFVGKRGSGESGEYFGEEGSVGGNQDVDKLSSLSCLSTALSEDPMLSSDGLWLRKYFKKSLVQGLKEIASKKPRDPVEYLGFWLREYRRKEEDRKLQSEMDNELKEIRKNYDIATLQEDSEIEGEAQYKVFSGEEGGGKLDSNFKNYESSILGEAE